MKTLLVTGGAGFIGSNLVEAMLNAGHRVIVADINSPAFPKGFEDRLTFRQADLTNATEALRAVRGADAVFHLAARVGGITYLHGTQHKEATALQENVAIDANVFKAVSANGIPEVIYASSVAVYPMEKQHSLGAVFHEDEFDAARVREFLIDPDGGYGWSKLVGEVQLHHLAGVKVGIARLFSIYGVREPVVGKSHAISDLIKKAMAYPKQEFVVWGNGEQTRDYLYVADCAAAFLKLEEKLASMPAGSAPVVVNIGSGVATSIRDIARIVIEISGKEIAPSFDAAKSRDFIGPISRTADIGRVAELLSWQPATGLEQGLTKTYQWVAQQIASL